LGSVEATRSVQIPENVVVSVDGRKIIVKGEKGTLTQDFSHAPISIKKNGDVILIQTGWPRKKEVAVVGTISSHVKNMILGVTKGFTYKLKIVVSHFPITVKIEDGVVLIENFTGERSPRKAKIVGDCKVKVEGEDVVVKGIDLEDVSQTAANIEQATKIKNKDPRVFLDGIYVYERLEGME
jgi:large subunit ribosomal protein L6